ncbi:type IX secretion system protein PorG [Pedobacter boryungensis]|uniref:Outer membrane beta-barrel protein n=1 Tax=Pedobacter boryungensis TaxID=869962 RepID=A0ABX2DEE3_9SPHI|nr:DUF6089 family protein [Pedobacter boryungensis]NQX32412.1 outer membrane beta-barrel protein [Pedobacter boryungensis]
MRYIKTVLIFVISFSLGNTSFAQRAEIGINAGGAGYLGDLNQNNPVKITGISAGAFGRINFNPYFGLGLHYTYGEIKGDDLESSNEQFKERALNFNTSIHEVSLLANLNFFDIYSSASKRRFTPYIFAGVGGFYFKPKATYNDIKYNLSDYITNADKDGRPVSYKSYAISVPYGAGVKYKLTDYLTLFSEIGYRTTFTDFIDDVGDYYYLNTMPSSPGSSRYFPPYNASTASRVGVPGTQRGDLRKRDTYMFVSIGISYTFVSQKCFTF